MPIGRTFKLWLLSVYSLVTIGYRNAGKSLSLHRHGKIRNITIRHALLGSFALLLVLSFAQGAVGLVKSNVISQKTTDLLDTAFPAMNEANAVNILVTRGRLWQFRFAAATTESVRLEAQGKVDEFVRARNDKIQTYETLVKTDEERRLYADLVAKNTLLKPIWQSFRDIPLGNRDAAIQHLSGAMYDRYRAVADATRALVDLNIARGTEAGGEIRAEQASAVRTMLLMLCVAVLLALGAMAYSFLGVSRPITRMTDRKRRLADGDAQADVPYAQRSDEIGSMSSTVQVFRDNLVRTRALEEETVLARASAEEQRKAGMRQMADTFERAVGGIVGAVSASATELQATAQTMTVTAGEVPSAASELSRQSEHLNAEVSRFLSTVRAA